jgi:hypothetical protein
VRSAPGWNVAVTLLAASIATVQTFPDTVVHPVQPAKADVASGVAVSVTVTGGEVLGYETVHPAVQGMRQEIPSPVTVPFPEPPSSTVSGWLASEKLAVTNRASSIVTVQAGAVPVQAPLQPEKTDPDADCAVSVTDVPAAKSAEHAWPQSIPAGLEVTVPAPSPMWVTASGKPDPVPKSTTFPSRSIPEPAHPVETQVPMSSQVTRNFPCTSGTTNG